MNRQQRRAGSRAQQLARLIRCPDCDSEVTVVKVAARHFEGQVRHDDTCPWLTAFEQAGGYRVRFGYRRP
jgi:hypothetical protein